MNVSVGMVVSPTITMLEPVLQHRFDVEYASNVLSAQQSSAMSLNTVSLDLDLLNRTIKFTMQQTVATEVFAGLNNFLSLPKHVTIRHLNGDGTIAQAVRYEKLNVIDHNLALDYRKATPAYHVFTLQFRKCAILEDV